MEFYYYSGNHRFGPLNAEKLKELAKNGKITKETIIESNGKRVPAGDVRGLFQDQNESAQYTESSPFAHNKHHAEPPVVLTHTAFDDSKQDANLTSIKWSSVSDSYKSVISYSWRLGCLSVAIGIFLFAPQRSFFQRDVFIFNGIGLFIFAWIVKGIYLTIDAHFAEQTRIASLLTDLKARNENKRR